MILEEIASPKLECFVIVLGDGRVLKTRLIPKPRLGLIPTPWSLGKKSKTNER